MRPGPTVVIVIAAVSAAPALAQQFVDGTASRFPVPNPEEFTNQLTIGDLDNDGDLDIIFAQDFNAQPQLYVNTGNGSSSASRRRSCRR